jgi:hypothetical protein
MPKIPTYDQLGQRVKAPTTQIGVRADTQAFVGAQLATADLFKKAGDVAYQFGMAEKKAKTETAYTELKSIYNDGANQLLSNSKATTAEEFEQELKDYNVKFEKNYAKYNLTPNQTRDVKNSLTTFVDSARLTGKDNAFKRARRQGSMLTNSVMKGYLEEIRKRNPEDPLRKQMERELQLEYAKAYDSGETAFLDYKTFDSAKDQIKLNDYTTGVDSSNLSTIGEYRKKVKEDGSLDAKLKASLLNLADAKENELTDDLFETVSTNFFQDETINKSKLDAFEKEIRTGKTITIGAKGQKQTIDISALDLNQRERLYASLKTSYNLKRSKDLNEVAKSIQKDVSGLTLKQIKDNIEAIKDGTLFPQFDDVDDKNALIGFYQREIDSKAKKTVANSKAIIKELQSKILTPEGITDDDLKTFKKARDGLVNAELFEQANNLDLSFNSLVKAKAEFSLVQFSSNADILAAQNKLKQNIGTAEGRETYNQFNKFVTERTEGLKDPIRYITSQDPNRTYTTQELIDIQLGMGIPGSDIRLTTDQQLTDFQAQFRGATNYQDKARIGNEFLAQFGGEQNRMLGNLVRKGTITTAENLLLAYPTEVNMEAVIRANDPEKVKGYNKSEATGGLNKNKREDAVKKVTTLINDYSNSLYGTGFMGNRDGGYTVARDGHVGSMKEIIINTAFLKIEEGLDPQKAAQEAYDIVIGKHFDLTNKVNDKVVRYPSAYAPVASEYTELLEISLKDNMEYLKKVIAPPPLARGTDPSQKPALDEKFYEDIVKHGSWRTTTDNTGVYLIDGSGNMVLKRAEAGDPSAPDEDYQANFVTVRFDDLASYESVYRTIGAGPQKRQYRKKRMLEYFNEQGHLY